MPKILVLVLDGFQFLDNDNEMEMDSTSGYLGLLLEIMRASGEGRVLKVLSSSDGMCRTLADETNVGVDGQVHFDGGGKQQVLEFWDTLDED